MMPGISPGDSEIRKADFASTGCLPTYQALKKPDSREPGSKNTGSKGRSRTADPSIMSATSNYNYLI